MSGVKTRINTRFSGKRKGQNGMQKSVCSVRLGIKTPPEGLLSGGVLLGFIFSVHLGCHGLPYVLPQADAVAVPRGLSSAPPHRAAGRRVRVVNFARYFWMACFWASVVMVSPPTLLSHIRPRYASIRFRQNYPIYQAYIRQFICLHIPLERGNIQTSKGNQKIGGNRYDEVH